MKYIFIGIAMTAILATLFFYKGHDRRKEGPGRWDRVYNPKEINT